MSYDVWLEAHLRDADEWIKMPDTDANITYNLAEMFLALPCGTPYQWQGTKASDLLPKLEASLTELRISPNNYREFEMSNGWGTIKGMQRFLQSVRTLCKSYPFAVWRSDGSTR